MNSTYSQKSSHNCHRFEYPFVNRQDVKSLCPSYRSQAYRFLVCITLVLGASVWLTSADTDFSMTVLDLPFSAAISNPCALVDDENLHRDALTEEIRESTRRTMIDKMTAKASLLKDEAEKILKTDTLTECSSLPLPLVGTIPTDDDILGKTPLEVLRLFYTSLLKHAAHIYFMAEELVRYSEDSSCESSDLSNSTESLAYGMLNLVCRVRFSTLAIQEEGQENSFEDINSHILGEKLSHQSQCSRRSLRDCQTIRSTIAVLQALLNYFQAINSNAKPELNEL